MTGKIKSVGFAWPENKDVAGTWAKCNAAEDALLAAHNYAKRRKWERFAEIKHITDADRLYETREYEGATETELLSMKRGLDALKEYARIASHKFADSFFK